MWWALVAPHTKTKIQIKKIEIERYCTAGDREEKVHAVDEEPEIFFEDAVQASSAEKEEWIVPVAVM